MYGVWLLPEIIESALFSMTIVKIWPNVALPVVDPTLTVAVSDAVPPLPEHVSVYVALAVNAPVDTDPDNGLLPLQDPEPEQDVAFEAAQESVLACPLDTEAGEADRDTVGPVPPPVPHVGYCATYALYVLNAGNGLKTGGLFRSPGWMSLVASQLIVYQNTFFTTPDNLDWSITYFSD